MDNLTAAFAGFLQRTGTLPAPSLEARHSTRLSRPPTPFSPFAPDDMQVVARLLLEFGSLLNEEEDSRAGLERVLARAESAAAVDGLALVQHALAIFAVHAAKNRPGIPRLPVPPMVFRADLRPPARQLELEALVTPQQQGEDRLHWFREDLFLNEHHRHWHIVYPTSGSPSPAGLTLKDRQGELFLYMHQQMLARYDTERLGVGLGLVEPLDIEASLADGYDPNAREPGNIGYSARPDDQVLPPDARATLLARKATIEELITTGRFGTQTLTLTADLVGGLLESNHGVFGEQITSNAQLRDQDALLGEFFQLHNFGHGLIANVPTPGRRVMSNPHTSLQDPVFWRWHRLIDDIAEAFYGSLEPYDFSVGDIGIRGGVGGGDSPDVLVLSESGLRAAGIRLDSDGDRGQPLAEFIETRFGVAQWDSTAWMSEVAAELRTGSIDESFVIERVVLDPGVGNAPVQPLVFDREHLFSERFVLVVRAENTGAVPLDATLRVFLCAEALLDLDGTSADKHAAEHRFWIELERVPVTLQPGRNVFTRLSDESAVIRKLNGRAPWPTASFTERDFGDRNSGADFEEDFCDCGWPSNLMLPRGTESGMGFRLAAMVSPGSAGAATGECGSRAFCGAGFNGYPEVAGTNLGFPFDRPAVGGTLAMIGNAKNIATRRIVIRNDPTLSSEFGVA